MPKDIFFKIAYTILKELHGSLYDNEPFNPDTIDPRRFGVKETYLLRVLRYLLDNGYVEGIKIENSKTGWFCLGLEDLEITPEGILYLEDNSKMKQMYNSAKEARDWIPGF